MENVTYCKIDSNLRKITLPGNEKILGVYHDKNVTRKHFKMPRYYQDNDMSEFSIKVNYVNEDKETDCYAVDDLAVTDEDYITFSWLVGATACRVPGMVGFVICFTKVDEESSITQEYNTELISKYLIKRSSQFSECTVSVSNIGFSHCNKVTALVLHQPQYVILCSVNRFSGSCTSFHDNVTLPAPVNFLETGIHLDIYIHKQSASLNAWNSFGD